MRYDARSEILSSVGDLSDIELFGTQLLVAPYVRSGIMLSDRLGIPESEVLSIDALCELYASPRGIMVQSMGVEDVFQGKLCLILKMGHEVPGSETWLKRYHDAEMRIAELKGKFDNSLDQKDSNMLAEIDLAESAYDDLQSQIARFGHRPLAVGDWIFTLQENTRGVSIRGPGSTQSRVLKALQIDYTVGYPCKFLYSADVYGRVDDPNVLA